MTGTVLRSPPTSAASKHDAQVTTDHDTIRKWAEKRGGAPASVEGTAKGTSRACCASTSSQRSSRLEPIAWDEFFDKFDKEELAFLYQEKTADGSLSRFHKFVNRSQAATNVGRRSGPGAAWRVCARLFRVHWADASDGHHARRRNGSAGPGGVTRTAGIRNVLRPRAVAIRGCPGSGGEPDSHTAGVRTPSPAIDGHFREQAPRDASKSLLIPLPAQPARGSSGGNLRRQRPVPPSRLEREHRLTRNPLLPLRRAATG
jgi:hypothetical protein